MTGPAENAETLEPLPHNAFAPSDPPDRAAREEALDPEGSFAVSAPAGSGKTGLLTQRVLTLLARCDQPEEVLAITFTRKAAGEMRERIMEALRQGAEQPEPDDPHAARTWQLARGVLARDAEQHWRLLLSPQRLRIQTIDSLCMAITRQLPLDSQLGAQPDILEVPELAYREAVRGFLDRLESDETHREDFRRLLRHLDNDLGKAEGLLTRLLAKRDQWLGVIFEARHAHARDYLEQVLTEVIREHLDQLIERIGYPGSDLAALADRAGQNARELDPDNAVAELAGLTGLPDADPEALPQWRALAEMLLTTEGNWRKSFNKNQGFPAGAAGKALKNEAGELIALLDEQAPDLAEQLHSVRLLPPVAYRDSQWRLLETLTRLLPLLGAELELTFKQLGATDYSAIAQAANLALGEADDPSELALKLDYQIRHILVDEFQDTSSPQLTLLEKLTAGWEPGDGRTLFIVGDGMQSCYGFRDANVGLFLGARRQGIGTVPLKPLDLQVNFRSQTDVVRWVNGTFHRAFPALDDISRGAVSYSPSIAFKGPLEGEAVQFHACLYHKDADNPTEEPIDGEPGPDKAMAELREAESVAELAERALREEPEGNVAILVRARTHLESVLPALARRGLSWQATEVDPLNGRMAIIDLMSLTRALLQPDDRIAWLSVLRAPWCGLDLDDLHRLVNTDLGPLNPPLNRPLRDWPSLWEQLRHYRRIQGLSPAGRRCLDRLMSVLEPAWQERHRKPLRQWLEGLWLALGGPALLAEPDHAQDVPAYFELIEQHQEGGSLRDWETFERSVAQLYAAPRPDADPRLQVMTLHKSKGLEFDTVILPGLNRGGRSNDRELLLWHERIGANRDRQLLLGPLAPTGADADRLYDFMKAETARREDYEATRLLYVGCTRAIRRLHLLASLPVSPKGEIKPQKKALLARLWSPLQSQMRPPPVAQPEAPATEQDSASQHHLLRLPPEWRAPSLEHDELLAPFRGREFDDEENRPEQEAAQARLARHTGTVLHNQLQRLTQSPIEGWSEDWAEAQRPFWTLQLRQLGWEADQIEPALEKIREGLRLTLADPDGRWLLDPHHEDSRCEWPLRHRGERGVQESVIDRSFVHEGVRWVVDYKSSQPDTGQSVATFVRNETDEYREQLARYARALQDLGETRPIRTALYFPLLNDAKRLVIVE